MLQVNYDILPYKKEPLKSIESRVPHNSFYNSESRIKPTLVIYKGIYVDDYFGFHLNDIEKFEN